MLCCLLLASAWKDDILSFTVTNTCKPATFRSRTAVFSRNHHNNQAINQRSNKFNNNSDNSPHLVIVAGHDVSHGWLLIETTQGKEAIATVLGWVKQEWCCQDQEQWKWDVMMCLRVGQFRWNEPPTYPGLQRRKIYSNIWTTVYLIVLTDR